MLTEIPHTISESKYKQTIKFSWKKNADLFFNILLGGGGLPKQNTKLNRLYYTAYFKSTIAIKLKYK